MDVCNLGLGRRVSSHFVVIPEQDMVVYLTDGKQLSLVGLESGKLIRSEVLSQSVPENAWPLACGRYGLKFCLPGPSATQLHFFD